MVHASLALLVAALGCASPAPRATTTPPAPIDDVDRADPCDMCVVQDEEDAEVPESADGCAGSAFRVTDQCALAPGEQARAARIAAGLLGNPHVTTVRLVSSKAACAEAARDALVRAGLAAARLELATTGKEPWVLLEVGSWDGRRCAP